MDRPDESSEASVISPFSDATTQPVQRRRKGEVIRWVSLIVIFCIFIVAGSFILFRYLNDPLRTLEPFSVSKYLENYKALAGSKFRGDLRVENDLGWKEGTGRLMIFSFQDDSRPIVVMIPPHLAGIYFTKGQSYTGELEVKEGGLIYANSIRKN